MSTYQGGFNPINLSNPPKGGWELDGLGGVENPLGDWTSPPSRLDGLLDGLTPLPHSPISHLAVSLCRLVQDRAEALDLALLAILGQPIKGSLSHLAEGLQQRTLLFLLLVKVRHLYISVT